MRHGTFFRSVAWLLVMAIAAFTLSPIEWQPTTAAPANLERFAAFAAVGAAFWLGYPNRRIGSILLVIAIAGLLEILQHVVPGRHGEPLDFVVKSFSSVFGAVFALLSARIVQGVGTAQKFPGQRRNADPSFERDASVPTHSDRTRIH